MLRSILVRKRRQTEKVFVCHVRERLDEEKRERWRKACEGLPEYRDSGYCVLHYPGEDKRDNFTQVLASRLAQKDHDFGGTVFPEGTSNFEGFDFDADANFDGANFLGGANFREAKFGGDALFRRATFEGLANFFKSTFERQAHFSRATFEKVSFEDVTFTQEAYFDRTTFKREAYFRGLKTFLRIVDFQFTRIEKPELFSFHRVRLCPSWFINVDPRKFDFTDVQWPGQPDGPKVTLDDEIRSLLVRRVQSSYNPYSVLSQACRRLSANAEENQEYPLANEFHYWSMDALRKSSWRSLGLIGTLYWVLSGYGVRAGRAFGVLAVIAVLFAVLFMIVGHSSLRVLPIVGIWQALADAGQALMYSFGVMARLRPEPIPEHMGLFQILVTIEGILGPFQIALLALAIRRKVMR